MRPARWQSIISAMWCGKSGRPSGAQHCPLPCAAGQPPQPKIPEETNDYLFSLGYEGNTVYLDWFHFLADGRGSAPFFTLLLKLYCNLRSNAGFVCEDLASDPPYDVEQLLARYPESQVANDMQKDVLQIHEGTPRFQRAAAGQAEPCGSGAEGGREALQRPHGADLPGSAAVSGKE